MSSASVITQEATCPEATSCSCSGYLRTADDPGEVGLFWGVDQQLGLVGSFSLVLSADLQRQSVVISDVNLIPVAGTRDSGR